MPLTERIVFSTLARFFSNRSNNSFAPFPKYDRTTVYISVSSVLAARGSGPPPVEFVSPYDPSCNGNGLDRLWHLCGCPRYHSRSAGIDLPFKTGVLSPCLGWAFP